MIRALDIASLAFAAFTLAIGCRDERAHPTASASPIETASASEPVEDASTDAGADAAVAIVDAGAPKPPRPLARELDPPDEAKSPLPKLAEWTDVPRRAVVQRGPYDCTLQHVREWHRITCSCTNATVALVAGERNGVSVWATASQAQLFFPVRRGDARAFEVTPHAHTEVVQNAGPYGPSAFEVEGGPPVVISETWLEGADHPTLVIQ